MWFTSDNAGPAHPKVMEALARANEGYAPSYGADALSARVRDRLREVFEAPEAAVYLVSTGTAANALGLAALTAPWATVFCHDTAHVEEDECGAPEFYTGGAKLSLVGGADGKMTPAALQAAIAARGTGVVHSVQPGPVTLTQTTERGTVYSLAEIRALADVAKAHGLPVHMDGARFANALVALDCAPADMTWRAGVDVLSFGGTKNGLIAAEAVILFDPARAWEFELRRKRAAHLFSKYRYLAAQMDAYLEGDLWLEMARAANARAAALGRGLAQCEGVRLHHPVDANMMFPDLPAATHAALQAAGAHYYASETAEGRVSARLVCNWATTGEEVEGFVAAARGA